MTDHDLTISFTVDGETAVVTGAAQGIGQAAAVALAQQGADVACVDLDRLWAVNVKGSFHWAVAASRSMIPAGRGRIVLMASQAALVSLPNQSAYTASKGAIASLARSLAIDWAKHGINVNAVCPTFIWTPMAAPMLEIPEVHAAAIRRIPLRRVGLPADVGGVIAFLCSPASSLITGSVLPVDGGWTAGEPALPL